MIKLMKEKKEGFAQNAMVNKMREIIKISARVGYNKTMDMQCYN